MNDPAANVFHVLSLPKRSGDRVEARGTIRRGGVDSGKRLWFVTPSGQRYDLEVVSVNQGERHVLLELSGSPESLESLAGGFYLYG